MLINPPPARCEGCGRRTTRPAGVGIGPAAGDPAAWHLLDGTTTTISLDDGRQVERGGQGWVCRSCGHTVPLSREHIPHQEQQATWQSTAPR